MQNQTDPFGSPHHGALLTAATHPLLGVSIPTPPFCLQDRFHTTSAQLRGSQSCRRAGRRTANFPGKGMDVLPPLVFSGAYSDKRQKHQQIFFALLKNDLFFQKQSAVKSYWLYQSTLFICGELFCQICFQKSILTPCSDISNSKPRNCMDALSRN